MKLFCRHNYNLEILEQKNKSGYIVSILTFICEKCRKKQVFTTTKLLLNKTNKSKDYLERENNKLVSIIDRLKYQQIQMADKIKDQNANERLISIYRPIVHNAKRLSVNELKNIQMEILESPNEDAEIILERRIEVLETEIEKDEKKL